MRKLRPGGAAAVAALSVMLATGACLPAAPQAGRNLGGPHPASLFWGGLPQSGGPSVGGPSVGGPSVGGPSVGGPSVGGPSVGSSPRAAPATPATAASHQPAGPMVATAGAGRNGPMAGHRLVTVRSLNWAGYAARRPGTTFRAVRASFFVPYVDCRTTPGSYSSHWAGLDGLGSGSVEQLGVAAGCSGSHPRYYAWYEMYPKPAMGLFPVKPGNAVRVSVSYQPERKRFALIFQDLTTGRHFSRYLKCAARRCARSSAEVISEAPSGSSGKILPLADYRAVSFSDITLTSTAGHRGGLVSRWWNADRIIGVGPSTHRVTAQPTAALHGQAFANYWLREN